MLNSLCIILSRISNCFIPYHGVIPIMKYFMHFQFSIFNLRIRTKRKYLFLTRFLKRTGSTCKHPLFQALYTYINLTPKIHHISLQNNNPRFYIIYEEDPQLPSVPRKPGNNICPHGR